MGRSERLLGGGAGPITRLAGVGAGGRSVVAGVLVDASSSSEREISSWLKVAGGAEGPIAGRGFALPSAVILEGLLDGPDAGMVGPAVGPMLGP